MRSPRTPRGKSCAKRLETKLRRARMVPLRSSSLVWPIVVYKWYSLHPGIGFQSIRTKQGRYVMWLIIWNHFFWRHVKFVYGRDQPLAYHLEPGNRVVRMNQKMLIQLPSRARVQFSWSIRDIHSSHRQSGFSSAWSPMEEIWFRKWATSHATSDRRFHRHTSGEKTVQSKWWIEYRSNCVKQY